MRFQVKKPKRFQGFFLKRRDFNQKSFSLKLAMEIANSCSDFEMADDRPDEKSHEHQRNNKTEHSQRPNMAADNDNNNNYTIPTKAEREKVLGFKPQKEISYNFLLPYSDLLDEESQQQWREIKRQMSLSVVLRDPKVGWVGEWEGGWEEVSKLHKKSIFYKRWDHSWEVDGMLRMEG